MEPLDGGGVAAGVDDEVLDGRLRAGARHRAVERRVAGLAQDALKLELVVERERARLHHRPAGGPGSGDDRSRVEHRARGG